MIIIYILYLLSSYLLSYYTCLLVHSLSYDTCLLYAVSSQLYFFQATAICSFIDFFSIFSTFELPPKT